MSIGSIVFRHLSRKYRENRHMKEKTALRRQIKTMLRQLAPERVREKSGAAAAQLLQSSAWRSADVMLGFCSLPDEVDTTALLDAAMRAGKTVAIPRIVGDDLVFHLLSDINAPYVINPFGIREPDSEWPRFYPEANSEQRLLVLTPGLAFDRRCYRLGRGKGFYDRFLSRLRANPRIHAMTVGVCFAEQLVERVPVSEHDMSVDMVVAERELFETPS